MYLLTLETYLQWIWIILYWSFFKISVDCTNNDLVVSTNCGWVKGVSSGSKSGVVFRGIPYASPPTENLRWHPPVPMKKEYKNCWEGVLRADLFGEQCIQLKMSDSFQTVGSEDCLFLNVWTPSLYPANPLPVMFWIHGGFLLSGNGNQQDVGYAPSSQLADDMNIVFVSVNYRLHAFGFMALKILEDISPTHTSGNYGLMDIIAGLEWVKENIRNFGGDPNQVTIFGQSSGGSAILALLASPLTGGLFSRAWLMSASPLLDKPALEAYTDNTVFMRNTGCGEDIACLLSRSVDNVTASVPWFEFPFWAMDDLLEIPQKNRFDGALLVIDGYVLKESPIQAWINGNSLDIPLLSGTTAQEADIGSRPEKLTRWTWYTSEYQRYVYSGLKPFGAHVAETALALYPPYVSTPEHQLTTMVTDIRVTCGTNYVTSIIAASMTSPVYRYVVSYIPSYPVPLPYTGKLMCCAFHGIDALAFFGTFHKLFKRSTYHDFQFEQNLQREVLNFVYSGHPFTAEWASYPFSTALLTEQTQVLLGENYHEQECKFWLEAGFFPYSWINK